MIQPAIDRRVDRTHLRPSVFRSLSSDPTLLTPDVPRRPGLFILVAISGMGPLALNIFMPSMPGLQRVFNADYATVQLTLTLFLIGLAVAQLAYGPISDRHGRRPVLLGGMAVFVLGSIACLVAPTIEILIAARVLQAVGACSGMVLSRAIIRDLYDREQAVSMLAYVMAAMVVIPMLAPSIGGVLDEWFGWWASFAFCALAGAIVLFASWLALHESHTPSTAVRGAADMGFDFIRLLRNPSFASYGFQGAFTSSAFFSFLSGAPYVTIDLLGRSPAEYGLYFISLSLMYILGNFLTGRLSKRIGLDRMIWIGTSLGILGTGLLLACVSAGLLTIWILFGTIAIMTVGNGLAIPNSMAGAISAEPRIAGAAAGLAGFLQMGLGAAATLLVGALLEDTALPLAAVMFSGAVTGFAIHAARQLRRSAPV